MEPFETLPALYYAQTGICPCGESFPIDNADKSNYLSTATEESRCISSIKGRYRVGRNIRLNDENSSIIPNKATQTIDLHIDLRQNLRQYLQNSSHQ